MKPEKLIGINPYHFEYENAWWYATRQEYSRAVRAGGGLPVTVHPATGERELEALIESLDGLVMAGGPDFGPGLYPCRQPELLGPLMTPEREAFDRTLFRRMYTARKPVLAICAGFQHINILYGGELYEDIPAQLKPARPHDGPDGHWVEHTVRLEPDSTIARVMQQERFQVRSTHHQGIRRLGAGLRAVGWSEDGLIEALEDQQHPETFMAVQWHPELSIHDPAHRNLFHWLVRQSLP